MYIYINTTNRRLLRGRIEDWRADGKIYTYIYIYIYVYVCMYIYIYMYIYTTNRGLLKGRIEDWCSRSKRCRGWLSVSLYAEGRRVLLARRRLWVPIL